MILDTSELPTGGILAADLCIVGAGAAGITLALQFIGTPVTVLLLESGGFTAEDDSQQLYAGTVADAAMHSPPDRYRQRRFGGSTTIWGGRCMPFDAIDFEPRAFMPHSGWPIGLEDIAPFYGEATRLAEAGASAYTVDTAFQSPLQPMIEGFESPHFDSDGLERFSCPTDFGARYRHRLAAADNIRVLLHANVTALHSSAAGTRVETLTVKSLAGGTFTVQAQRVVLASGGLEVPRLLLASTSPAHPRGLGNGLDVVGRYYMCHLAGTTGTLRLNPARSVWHGYDVADDGSYCRRRLALNAATQQRERIGNFIARLHHPRMTDPGHGIGILSLLYLARFLIPYEYGKRLHGEEKATLRGWFAHLGNVVLDLPYTIWFVWHLVRDRFLAARKFPSIIIRSPHKRFSLDFHAEQQPLPESRVTLGGERDALGMPRLHVDWRYTRGDVETVQKALALLAQDLEACGSGHFDYDPAEVEAEMIRYGAYGGHHIGTARMGLDPATSVVDADCRVHGIENLYIASAAVFPTSSQANPTLTLMALSLRLAAHLGAPTTATQSSP